MMGVTPILNIAAYRFVSLGEPAQWREHIRSHATAHSLKGTVLLAEEGINLCLAGTETSVRGWLAWLRAQTPFAGIEVKESRSEAVPFGKLRVKVKPEIIRMNHAAIQPQAQRAPAVDAKTLARWLAQGCDDAGRELALLDTRNAFEADAGGFRGALDWRIERFSEFPDALLAHRTELVGKTVVSYCTGGIRCEKAALFMANAGVANVLQLEGGILKYFEQTGGTHFDGACFVFDARTTLDAGLCPTASLAPSP